MKNRKLSIRISDADLQQVHEKAEQANLSVTDYVTTCCLEKEIVVIHSLDEVIRQQKGIGRNLNQLTTLRLLERPQHRPHLPPPGSIGYGTNNLSTIL